MSPNAAVVATQNIVVKIIPNDRGNPPGKLADAENHFVDGVFASLKLIGSRSGSAAPAPVATSRSRLVSTR